MRRLRRRLRRHSNVTSRSLAVRAAWPWYWRALIGAALLLLGYGLAYWQLQGAQGARLLQSLQGTASENQTLQGRVVQLERQLQVEHAAQSNLAKEMAGMQDEAMRLKEDIAFYHSILAEGGASQIKLHSVKLTKRGGADEYQYQILLVQSGRHDKLIQGSLRLFLSASQDARVELADAGKGIKVNFKYYQRIEGSFSVPRARDGQRVIVEFVESGSSQPKLRQSVALPT